MRILHVDAHRKGVKTKLALRERSKPLDNPASRRPRVESDRLTLILEVAAEVFLEQGFASASTNEIARRANASKTTFYSRFPTKEKLFHAVIKQRMDSVFAEIGPSLPLELPMATSLQQWSTSLLRAAISQEQVALIRVISMEAKRFPELGKRFFALGPGRAQKMLAEYIGEQIRRGNLRSGDPRKMAEHLISLIVGGPVNAYVLGLRSAMPQNAARAAHVEAGVDLFLRGYALPQASARQAPI